MATSVHESGHAVFADWLGVSVDFVSIAPDEKKSGETRLGEHGPLAAIPIAFAGRSAEELYCKIAPVPAAKAVHSPVNHSKDDREKAWAAAKELFPDVHLLGSRYMSVTESFVDEVAPYKWSTIERLAVALSQVGFMNGDEVCEIIERRDVSE